MFTLVVGIGYLVYEFGRIRAGYDTLEAARQRDALHQEIADLEARNLALTQSLNEFEK